MSYKIENGTAGLVDYKELEANILSSIREGKPLMGRDGALTQQIASIEICSEDVTSFSIGNYIKIEKRFYKIFELPLKDSSGKILKIEAIESV